MSQDTTAVQGVNDELFIAVLAQIEKHPETWDQGVWRSACGTSFCFAGWALHLSGIQWVAPLRNEAMYRYVHTEVGTRPAWAVAVELLGLPYLDDFLEPEEGRLLFSPLNTFAQLYRISADLMGVDETVLREKVAARAAGNATVTVQS
jgi:hypothetical protein